MAHARPSVGSLVRKMLEPSVYGASGVVAFYFMMDSL